MSRYHALPDADLNPPRVHTVGFAVTAGTILSMLAVLFNINNASAPNIPAEVIKSTREIERINADQLPADQSQSYPIYEEFTPSPSPSTRP